MAGKWMGDGRREDRGWRRGQSDRQDDDRADGARERRSFEGAEDERGGYEGDDGYEGGRSAVFGERESGAGYGDPYVQRDPRSGRGGWQDPEYRGVSPAMRRGGGYGHGRFRGQDYRGGYGPGGGRFYGDDAREPIYRAEYGEADFDDYPGAYDAGYSPTRARYHRLGYGDPGFDDPPYGVYPADMAYRARHDRAERLERVGREAGDFLHRAGERVASWFGGGSEARAYAPEYDRAHARGLGPKGYKRSDERISDDAHERLTDDPWLDASDIALTVAGGEVTLSGTAPSREGKHRAERIVEEIAGVTHVQNNLRVARQGLLRGDSTGYGDAVAEAQMRRDERTTGGTGERKA